MARAKRPGRPGRRRRTEPSRKGRESDDARRVSRRAVWPVIVAVVLVGVLFAGVYPTQTYFRQRDELDDKEAQLDDAQATNAELEGRVGELTDADNVELMAREEFGLVEPGEEVYAVVPSERTPVELPETWPLTQLSVRLERLVE